MFPGMLVFYDDWFSGCVFLALALEALTPVLIGHYVIMIIAGIMREMAPIPFSRSVHVLILFSNLMLLREELGVCLSGRSLAHNVCSP